MLCCSVLLLVCVLVLVLVCYRCVSVDVYAIVFIGLLQLYVLFLPDSQMVELLRLC